jgi:hypothetical protein
MPEFGPAPRSFDLADFGPLDAGDATRIQMAKSMPGCMASTSMNSWLREYPKAR